MLPDLSQLTTSLTILTAMITPAVLISAGGTLILSTSTRLGRVIDRTRDLSARIEELMEDQAVNLLMREERRDELFRQLDFVMARARLLQRSLKIFYIALTTFVLTSFAIGLIALVGRGYEWIPVTTALGGAAFLSYGSILLIRETYLATQTIRMEMDFTRKLTTKLRQYNETPALLTPDGTETRIIFAPDETLAGAPSSRRRRFARRK